MGSEMCIRDSRRTYQCHPSYATIGKAVGMSNNTVRKYVQELEERGLIVTERTSIITRDGRKQNGSLLYTILPIQFSIDQFYQRQMDAVDSKGTAASGKTHGADPRVKQQICFSASCCCDRKNRGTHRCEARYSNGAARACGPAAPMNCVNPPLAGSRSSAAVILLPQFFSVPNLKAFCADFCAFKCAAQGGSPFPRTVRPVCRCVCV